MPQEIERKFLIKGDYKIHISESFKIKQGYLSTVPERSVRVRIKGNTGFLTIKGIGDASGVSRYEWEREISIEEANDLLRICEPGIIDKIRHIIKVGHHIYEVDEFYGENEGLLMAEIELNTADEVFEKPKWLGEEVTGNKKYYNVMLMQKPFKKW